MIDGVTSEVLSSIRQHFPEGEIILSTWRGSEIDNLIYDILVENDDPGVLPSYYGKQNNLNRQIASTAGGMKKATRHFAVKVRTDVLFTNNNLISLMDRVESFPRPNHFRVFKKRLIICSEFTWNPERNLGLFHPSDLFMFGLTDDLLKMWGCDFASPDNPDVNSPEKYVFVQAILAAKLINLKKFERLTKNKLRNLWRSELALFSNFYLFSAEEIGLKNKRHFEDATLKSDCYSPKEWGVLNTLYSKNPMPVGRFFNVGLYGFLRKLGGLFYSKQRRKFSLSFLFCLAGMALHVD